MKLRKLLATVDDVVQLPQHPAMDAEIKNLKMNSHACVAGDLFIGMPGNTSWETFGKVRARYCHIGK